MDGTTDAEANRELLRRVARPYAHALLIKIKGLKDPILTAGQRQSLKGSMKEDLRKCSDALIPDLVPYRVSKAAAAAAAERGVDLTRATFRSQWRFDPGRTLFHYEHYATLESIVIRLERVGSVDAAVDVLEELLQVAWILKCEDRRLGELGYRHVRPDPAAAYAEAGIELVRLPVR